MKYCLVLTDIPAIEKADEILLEYNKKNLKIIDYIKEHSNQRIILNISNLDEALQYKEIEKLNAIYVENKLNFSIKLPSYNEKIKDLLPNLQVPFFFDWIITDWDELLGYIQLGVSDVYIGNNLGFELDKVAEVAHQNNVQIRVFPNVAQSSWKETSGLKKFFIRPEDVTFYSDYVDVFEFWGTDLKKQEIFYKIYNKQEWFGSLNEIIYELNEELDSRYIIPRFAEKRVRCKKECLKGGKCQICDRIKELSYTLEEAHIIVDYNNKEDLNNGKRSEN